MVFSNNQASKMTTRLGKKGQVIHSQTRECIARIIEFMKKEAEQMKRTGIPLIPIANYKQRVIAATGISHTSYEAIQHEAANISAGVLSSFSTPGTKRLRRGKKTELVEEAYNIKKTLKPTAIPSQNLPIGRHIHEKHQTQLIILPKCPLKESEVVKAAEEESICSAIKQEAIGNEEEILDSIKEEIIEVYENNIEFIDVMKEELSEEEPNSVPIETTENAFFDQL